MIIYKTTFKRHKSLSLNLAIFVLGFAWMGVISTQVLKAQIVATK
jgi:competence protein ComEC